MNQKQQQIIFKTNSFPNASETFVVSNIVEAIKNKYLVNIIVNKLNPISKSSQANLLNKYKLLEKIEVFSLPIIKINRYFTALLIVLHPLKLFFFIKYMFLKKKKSLNYIFNIQFYWKFRKANVFHVHFATEVNPLFDLKKIGLLKSKIIVTFHGYDAHFLPEKKSLETLLIDFKNHVSTITVNSNYLKMKLLTKGFIKENILIIPIGYDEDIFKIENRKLFSITPFKLITVGRLVSLKGQKHGIKAVHLLVNCGYDISYTIVGEGEEYDNLQSLIIKLGLESNVKLVGVKSQVEIKELLKQHHLFLMTSTIDEHNRREAFGVVSLEAQAMGLPIIGFDSGGFSDTMINGETGFLVVDKDYNEMANSIKKLVANKNLYEEMSNYARTYIQNNFNTHKTINKYFKYYN